MAQGNIGYTLTKTAPVQDMLPISQLITMNVYDASGGGLVQKQVSVLITDYVIWQNPVRPPEYRLEIVGTSLWFIVNRQTIDALRVN
jgi:hypothetical protein